MLKFSDFIYIEEAAEFIGVCTNTLRNWEKEQKLKTYRHPINNYRLYRKEELKDLLKVFQK